MRYHSFHFLAHWAWYEWLGIVAPVAILWWFAKLARAQALANLNLLCRALIIYDLVYFAAAWQFNSLRGSNTWRGSNPCAVFICCTSCSSCLRGDGWGNTG